MPITKDEWLSRLRAEIPQIAPEDVRQALNGGDDGITLVDVRETEEYRQGTVPGAVHLPRGFLEMRAGEVLPRRDARIVAYCQSGVRSLFAAEALRQQGFTQVASMAGGFTRWKQNGHPFEAPAATEDRRGEWERATPAFADHLGALRQQVREAAPGEARRLLEEGALAVDVREADEMRRSRMPGALHLPRGFLELQAEQRLLDPARPLLVYSGEGLRGMLAAEILQRLGYRRVTNLQGGLAAWEQAGYALEIPETLSERERERYLRHLSIDEVGEAGQIKLKKAKVLCIGAGGLGSPAAYYLGAAGVGTLGLVDYDVVDRTNLQRQILHADDRVGMLKTESARRTLLGLNPDVRVVTHNERLTSENVDSILSQYDVILDGCDNFPTRYLVNDACVKHRKPNVHGSIYRFEGQLTVFWPGKGPCYRCLYPEPPPPELAPSCAEAGVLGVLPGVIGVLEAIEVIKIILGIGDVMVGRLLTYDALETRFRELKLRRNPDCSHCAEGRTFPGYTDYVQFCRV